MQFAYMIHRYLNEGNEEKLFISYGLKSRNNYLPHSQNIDKSILKSSFEHTFILQVY